MNNLKKTTIPTYLYFRLRLGYFLQFAIWGCWGIALPGFLSHWFSGREVGIIYTVTSLGTVIAPFAIGPLADRCFHTQKFLGFLHLCSAIIIGITGICCVSGINSGGLDFTLILILAALEGLCFMPTVALMNTIIFRHLPDFSKAPRIFIFGTLGWIASNIFVEAFLGGAANPYFLFAAASGGVLMSVYSLTLPNTPPVFNQNRSSGNRSTRPSAFEVFRLFKRKDFTVFMICSFMVLIFAGGFYYPSLVLYLSENGIPSPLAMSTINQFSELIFMSLLGFCILKIGLKGVLTIGMSAWSIRYFFFAQGGWTGVIGGLALHGLAFAFLYSASYMFGDKIAPKHLKASVQSLIAFLLLGIGPVIGSILFGIQLDRFSPQLTQIQNNPSENNSKPLPRWEDPAKEYSPLRWLELSKSVKYLLGDKNIFKPKTTLGTYQNDREQLTSELLPEYFTLDGIGYTRSEMKVVFDAIKIRNGSQSDDFSNTKDPAQKKKIFPQANDRDSKKNECIRAVSRKEYLNAGRHDWHQFYIQPAFYILFWVLLFALVGKNPNPEIEPDSAQIVNRN